MIPALAPYLNGGVARKQISFQPPIPAPDATGPAEAAALGLNQVACVLPGLHHDHVGLHAP